MPHVIPIPVGGGTKLFAAIGVTYPAGSTVTCTNGSKTLTAKTNTGQWVFSIPVTGTWTVTATNGTNSKSQSVEISSEGQFETVTIKYATYIYEQGVTKVSFVKTWGEAPSTSIDESVWYVSADSISVTDGVIVDNDATTSTANKICRGKKVDLTDVDTLFFECKYNPYKGYSGHFGVANTWPAWGGDFTYAAKVDMAGKDDMQILSLDVSSFEGEYWVCGYYPGLTAIDLYNIWY